MQKSTCISFLLIFFINIMLIPQMLLSSELETETPKSTLIRTNSEEELFQLQERKEQLLQQRKLLKQEARHREIEKLKQEIQELEAGNFSLQQAHEVELTEREKTKENQLISPSAEITSPTLISRKQQKIGKLIKFISFHEEEVLKNMHSSRQDLSNPAVIYHLAKLCRTSIPEVSKALGMMRQEMTLRPHDEIVKAHLKKRLLEPFENDLLYQEDLSFENVPFSAKFYATSYDPSYDYTSRRHDFFVFPIHSQVTSQFPQLGGKYMNKLEELLEGHKLECCYVSKNKLHCNFGFTRRGTPFGGFLLLEKPLEMHLLLE